MTLAVVLILYGDDVELHTPVTRCNIICHACCTVQKLLLPIGVALQLCSLFVHHPRVLTAVTVCGVHRCLAREGGCCVEMPASNKAWSDLCGKPYHSAQLPLLLQHSAHITCGNTAISSIVSAKMLRVQYRCYSVVARIARVDPADFVGVAMFCCQLMLGH